MIRYIIRTREGNIVEYEVSGHSGYEDRGRDIVCAGVSAIAQTAAVGLCHHLSTAPVWQQKEGYLKVKLRTPLKRDEAQAAQVILKTMQLGIEALSESYPEYVAVEYEEV